MHLPADAATVRAVTPAADWADVQARLLAAIYQALTGKRYPEAVKASRAQQVADVKDRLARWRERHPK